MACTWAHRNLACVSPGGLKGRNDLSALGSTSKLSPDDKQTSLMRAIWVFPGAKCSERAGRRLAHLNSI